MKRAKRIVLTALLLLGSLPAADSAARKLLQHEEPEYPLIAAKMSLRGVVKLRVWVAPDGSVRRVEYIGGHPLLAESAVRSVKNWKFEPAPKESTELVEVRF